MTMQFFEFGPVATGFAYIWSVASTLDRSLGKCKRCGRRVRAPRFRPIRAEVEGPGKWPDCILCTDGQLQILSRRVVDALQREGVAGFRAHPVTLTDISTDDPPPGPSPKYMYLEITGRIDLDLDASGVRRTNPCDVCFQEDERTQPNRFRVVDSSWDGSELMTFRNYPSGFALCTDKLLLLAHKHRWAGFRFDPLDVPRRRLSNWDGIDYLSRTWPPKLTPPSRADDRTLRQWIDYAAPTKADLAAEAKDEIAQSLADLDATDEEDRTWYQTPQALRIVTDQIVDRRAIRASEALVEFPEQAAPALLARLRTGTRSHRRIAAIVLCALRREHRIELSEDDKRRIVENGQGSSQQRITIEQLE